MYFVSVADALPGPQLRSRPRGACPTCQDLLAYAFQVDHPMMPTDLTEQERSALLAIKERATRLAAYLRDAPLPTEASALTDWLNYLTGMKAIAGNSDNDVSLVASLMARDWLCAHLPMRAYDAVRKSQNAPGLDVDEQTVRGERVVGEIKTTEPYQKNDLGSAQIDSFRKDFAKLNAADATHRFFFVTTSRAFAVMRAKYAREIPQVTVVLLPTSETFRAGAEETSAPAAVLSERSAPVTAAPQRSPAPIVSVGTRGTIFPLTLRKTYFEQGFFNVTVDYDRYVRQSEGPVELVLVSSGKEHRVDAKVNRTANTNGTARIMGGARLREWFLSNTDVGATVSVDLSSQGEIRLTLA